MSTDCVLSRPALVGAGVLLRWWMLLLRPRRRTSHAGPAPNRSCGAVCVEWGRDLPPDDVPADRAGPHRRVACVRILDVRKEPANRGEVVNDDEEEDDNGEARSRSSSEGGCWWYRRSRGYGRRSGRRAVGACVRAVEQARRSSSSSSSSSSSKPTYRSGGNGEPGARAHTGGSEA